MLWSLGPEIEIAVAVMGENGQIKVQRKDSDTKAYPHSSHSYVVRGDFSYKQLRLQVVLYACRGGRVAARTFKWDPLTPIRHRICQD
jgi:hypothetical protein